MELIVNRPSSCGSHQRRCRLFALRVPTGHTDIGQVLIVDRPGWEQALENNKQALTAGFVAARARLHAYPKLYDGGSVFRYLNYEQRQSVVAVGARYVVGGSDLRHETRSQVLRAVAEDQLS